jgi:TB2/DP1, HVA22 family
MYRPTVNAQRHGNVNINDLINKFEVPEPGECVKPENLRYNMRGKPMYDDEQLYDENRIVRAYQRNNAAYGSSMHNAKQVTKQTIVSMLYRIGSFLEMLSKLPFPRMSVMSFGLTSLLTIFMCPRGFTERALYPGFRIIFSIIYPAYRSFKAIRNKDIHEYLKWIVYWICYACFTCFELLTDALLSWFPFYYEIKVIFLIWLLGPSSRGAMRMYKSLIHPSLISKEQVNVFEMIGSDT